MGDLDHTEYEMLAAFRYALRQFLRFSEHAARAAGITPQQHQALLAIKGFPRGERVTIGDLAERLQHRHHSTVELVNRMAQQGLVMREESTEDRRQVYVALTEQGEAMLADLAAVHREELRRIGPELQQLLGQLAAMERESGGSAG